MTTARKEWVSWEEFDALFPCLSPYSAIDFSRIGGLVPGSIPFGGAGGMLDQNTNLFWDATNEFLGIHEDTPTALQHITGGGTIPCLCLEAGAEGELVTPDGQQLRIGHWNGVDTFTERLRIDDAGKFYVSYLTTGSVLFAGANGEMKQDLNNFEFDVANSRLGLNLGGGAINETLELSGNLRLDGTSYSLLCNYVGAGREILSLRAKSGLGDGSGMNFYGDGDSTSPGQIKFFTNSLTAMTIDFAQLTTVVDLDISAPVNVYNLSHDAFADWVAAKHYDWTNETHDFLTTGTLGCGVLTSGNIIIPDAGYIGSVSDTNAIKIEADGDVLLSQNLGIGVSPLAPLHIQAATTLTCQFDAIADDVNIDFRSGLDEGGTESCQFRFFEATTAYWRVGKDTGNDFYIYDDVANLRAIKVETNGNIQFYPAGGNVGLKTLTFGTNADSVFAIATGTAPTTSPADCFQMYSADIGAGNAAPHFRTENDEIIRLYQQALIADPAGQANDLDSEARTAINAILDLLENNGLMANA